VQTGIGRTGKWFGFQHTGIRPDVITLAKGLGGGLPIGACLAAGPAAGTFKPGTHGSTFGGNPLVCAASLATLETIETEGLLANANRMGELIRTGVAERLAGTEGVKDIRGQGLMIGIELDRPCGELVKLALGRGLLINVTADTVIRLVPPLVISEVEVLQLLETLVPLVADFLAAPAAVAAAH